MNTKQILTSFFIIAFTLISCNPSTQFEDSTEVNLESKKEAFFSSEQVQLTGSITIVGDCCLNQA